MHKSQHIITSKNYLIMAVIAFALGILWGTQPLNGPAFSVMIFVTVLFCVLTVILISKAFIKRTSSLHIKHFLLPWVLILFFLLGFLRIYAFEAVKPDSLRSRIGDELWLSGTITSPVEGTQSGFSHSFEFEVTQADSQAISPQTIIMYIPNARGKLLSEGDTICCWTKLRSPKREPSATVFDYYTYLRGRNIFLMGETQNANKITLKNSPTILSVIKEAGRFSKEKVSYAADVLCFDRPQHAAILKGILVGDKSDFPDQLYNRFSNAGISHIASVSGMHLSILFALLTLLFYKLRTHKRVGYILTLPFILILASAVGFTPSVCRSALMLTTMIVAKLLHKHYSPINALFLSLGIILFVVPYSLFSASLILSFGATLAILALFGYLFTLFRYCLRTPKFRSHTLNTIVAKSKDFICSSLAISLSALIGTIPSTAFFFGTISKIQIITNLWIIPVVTVAFCLGFAGCLLFYVCPRLTVAVLYYPLKLLVGIISKTAALFGTENFVFNIDREQITIIHIVLYLILCISFYCLVKTLSDRIKEKQLTQKG